MEKIIIYYGPRVGFEKCISNEHECCTFDSLIRLSEKKDIDYSDYIRKNSNLVAFSMSYSGITESAEQNFASILRVFIDYFEYIYLQNPTENIKKEIERSFDKEEIEIKYYDYPIINKDNIFTLNNNFDNEIIGQKHVKKKLLSIFYNIYRKKNEDKPIVIMFYGSSGVGKTETVKFLSKILNRDGKLFRKQFSMFQNNEFGNYLFGSKHNESSFAKDLLERESNVILLDEFGVVNPLFFSAFYQLFDEGIFEDKNYKVNLKNAIIICTSNYQTPNDIRKALGDPIFFRFDKLIKFDDLGVEDKKEIISRVINNEYMKLEKNEKKIINLEELINKYNTSVQRFLNYRQIESLIKDDINNILVKVFLENNQE
ncbi:MAG: hypothetical protein K0R54_4339 [Clostridiaceae bacterium]|jgi:ATP-dependent Clp protease ATP-binding subunit ClpA|nr:hypothetical protein [Clostridiaceae bacterium]